MMVVKGLIGALQGSPAEQETPQKRRQGCWLQGSRSRNATLRHWPNDDIDPERGLKIPSKSDVNLLQDFWQTHETIFIMLWYLEGNHATLPSEREKKIFTTRHFCLHRLTRKQNK